MDIFATFSSSAPAPIQTLYQMRTQHTSGVHLQLLLNNQLVSSPISSLLISPWPPEDILGAALRFMVADDAILLVAIHAKSQGGNGSILQVTYGNFPDET